jgi:3-deoxy-D-manno-octulosonic-acid transferase
MNQWLYRAYTILGSGLVVYGLPPFLIYTRLFGRHGRHLKERLGCVPPSLKAYLGGTPRIWLHAVSLGEVAAAGAVIQALRRKLPACSITLSTTTEHGRTFAEQTMGEQVPVIYGPVDFIGSVRSALSRIRPHVLGFLETEIWPAWFVEARRMGVHTAVINGRISVRSIRGYLRFRPFFREVLRHVETFSMISDRDAKRMVALGADPKEVLVNGNAKYDVLPVAADDSAADDTRRILNLRKSQAVFVAGSTREGEEEMLLDTFLRMRGHMADLVFVIVPRHIRRIGDIASLLQRRGVGYQLWSDLVQGRILRKEPIVLVDTFGQLFHIYSIGTIIFCGGSLTPTGGHNPLEAAVWGKVVFYGPSMEDFEDAKELLENAGAGFQVSDSEALARKALGLYLQPGRLSELGRRAKEAVLKNGGAAARHAEVICQLAGRAQQPWGHA